MGLLNVGGLSYLPNALLAAGTGYEQGQVQGTQAANAAKLRGYQAQSLSDYYQGRVGAMNNAATARMYGSVIPAQIRAGAAQQIAQGRDAITAFRAAGGGNWLATQNPDVQNAVGTMLQGAFAGELFHGDDSGGIGAPPPLNGQFGGSAPASAAPPPPVGASSSGPGSGPNAASPQSFPAMPSSASSPAAPSPISGQGLQLYLGRGQNAAPSPVASPPPAASPAASATSPAPANGWTFNAPASTQYSRDARSQADITKMNKDLQAGNISLQTYTSEVMSHNQKFGDNYDPTSDTSLAPAARAKIAQQTASAANLNASAAYTSGAKTANTNADTGLKTAQTGYYGTLSNYINSSRVPLAQAEIDAIRQGKIPLDQASIQLIQQGRLPQALAQVDQIYRGTIPLDQARANQIAQSGAGQSPAQYQALAKEKGANLREISNIQYALGGTAKDASGNPIVLDAATKQSYQNRLASLQARNQEIDRTMTNAGRQNPALSGVQPLPVGGPNAAITDMNGSPVRWFTPPAAASPSGWRNTNVGGRTYRIHVTP